MKKILFITALLIGFFGQSQISTDSILKYVVRDGRIFKVTVPSVIGGSPTTDASALTTGVLADGRVQESNVTQHQAALSIAKSQIPGLVDTDNQQIIDFSITSNIATLELEDGGTETIDLSPYLDNKNVASGSLSWPTLTLTLSDATTVNIDLSGIPSSGGGFANPATEILDMDGHNMINIAVMYVRGSSTTNNDLVIGRNDSGSYLYDEDAYNNLSLGYLSIAAATGKATYDGDFDVQGAFTVNGSPVSGSGINSDVTDLTAANAITNMYTQTEEGFEADPAPSAGELPVITNPAPADIETAGTSTLDISGKLMLMVDDRDDDSPSFTLQNVKEGHLFIIYVNQASEPSITASGWTVTPVTDTLDWTDDSLANTDLVLYLFAQGDGVIDKTWRKR